MIFKSRKAFEEEVNRRVNEIEKQYRDDRHFFDLEEQLGKLKWRVDDLEERLNPSPKTPVHEEYPVTTSW